MQGNAILGVAFLFQDSLLSPPMQFSSIIAQQDVKQHLIEMVLQNRLSHALLFLGKEGSGALPLALAFAQYLTCEKVQGKNTPAMPTEASLFGDTPAPEEKSLSVVADSCGTCAACQKAAQLIHPDIHFSYPTVTKKAGEKPIAADFITDWRGFIKMYPYGNLFDWIELIKEKENSQGKITARECDEIIKKLSLKSFESVYKVLIMWMPEELDKEGNKLLKIIEEPPPNTLFILVAENEEHVLPTILSRCQLVKIPALETKDIEEALINRHKTEAATARQVANVSEGNYREALQLVQHAEEDWQALLREWLNAILKTGPVAQTKWVEEISRLGREKQKQFLRYFNHLLGQAIQLRVAPPLNATDGGTLGPESSNKALSILDTEKDFALRLNKIAGIEQQEAIIEELDRASYFIERNANGKMLFHALTIKLYHIIQDKVVFLMD
jgi:DNA polymerase-3 subunit delta'